jgi:hypothetical protein
VKLNDTASVAEKKSLKVITVKETINVNHDYLFVLPVQGDDFQASIKK